MSVEGALSSRSGTEPRPVVRLVGGEQLELLDPAGIETEEIRRDEARGVFSGERLARLRPVTYRQVVSLLAAGAGVRRIARDLGVSPHTVMAVRRREHLAIGDERRRIASQLGVVSELALERVADALPEITIETASDLQRVMLVGAIATDKYQLLSGGATSRVEHVGAERLEDVADVLQALPAGPAIEVDAEVVEAPSGTGSPANAAGQKDAPAAPTTPAAPAPDRPARRAQGARSKGIK